jgi:phospholipase/lecithinase/hemolysin
MRQQFAALKCRAIGFVAFVLFSGSIVASPFQELVIVGDSLSDTGNIYAATGNTFPVSPPNAPGRFSNGPVWVEVLADEFGLPAPTASLTGGTNFAFGGAPTGSRIEAGLGGVDIGMAGQVAQIGANSSITARLPDALTVVWGGANDLLLSEGTGYNAHPTDTVNNLVARVTSLIGLGADAFLLPNLPPLDQTPKFLGETTENQQRAAEFSTDFDSAYRTAVAGLAASNPTLDFYYFDVYTIIEDVLANPNGYGFTNVTDPARDGLSVVPNPDEYLYWDDIHPTTAAHAWLGQLAAERIPLPSVVLLLIPGFCALLISARRRPGQNAGLRFSQGLTQEEYLTAD